MLVLFEFFAFLKYKADNFIYIRRWRFEITSINYFPFYVNLVEDVKGYRGQERKTHMRMLRGKLRDKNSEQNLLIEAKELRSISIIIT